MGELGLALSDKDYLSIINPASLTEMRLTRFETGLAYSGSNQASSLSSVFHTSIHLTGMMTGFPIDHDKGITFTIGLVPYSDVGYKVQEKQTNSFVKEHTIDYTGQGGMYKFVMGTSYKLPLNISLGATYDYYFGTVENTTAVTFNSDSTYGNVSFNRTLNYHGMGATVGLISGNLSSIFGDSFLKDLRVGFVYTPEVTLSRDSVDNSTTGIGIVQTSTGSIKSNLPYRMGLGASLNLLNKYTFTLDYMYQPFSQFTTNNIASSNMQDYYKMSLGFEFRDLEIRNDSFWDHVILRAGVSLEQTQYLINGNGIKQFSIYAGIGMPISFDNTIDLGFQYGRRGTTDNSLLQENIFKFNVTLSIGEIWFLQTDR